MKLTIQYHSGNPNLCRIPELDVRRMPVCEGGGWWMPRAQAERLIALSSEKTSLTEDMELAGFEAIEEYERWKTDRVFPRPSLIAHIWNRMVGDASKPHHSAPDGEDLSHDFEDHDCGEDTCVCTDQ